jgi:hypothetical protein
VRAHAFALVLFAATAGCSEDDPAEPPLPPGGTLLWGQRFGKSTDIDAVALAVGAAGEVVVGGRFFATVDFGSGPVTSPANNWQAFVAKYDGEGSPVWARSLGDIFEEQVTKVAIDGAGNVYIAGMFRGTLDLGGDPLESDTLGTDLFVAKLAPDGTPVWSKRFGTDDYDQLLGMVVDAQGGVALFGSVSDGTDFGTGPITFNGRPFLAKLGPDGAVAYAKPFEPPGAGDGYYPSSIAIDSAGGIVVSAPYYYGNIDYESQGLYLSRLDPAGELDWVQDFSPIPNSMSVTGVSVAANDTIFLTGGLTGLLAFEGVTSSGTDEWGDAFVAAFGPGGAPRWIRRFSPDRGRVDQYGNTGPGRVTPNAISAVGDGVVLAGGFLGAVDLGGGVRQSAEEPETFFQYADDAFAVRLDSKGNYLWDVTFGNTTEQTCTSVGADPSGDVFIAGPAQGSLPFGEGAFPDTSYYEAFLVKLAR